MLCWAISKVFSTNWGKDDEKRRVYKHRATSWPDFSIAAFLSSDTWRSWASFWIAASVSLANWDFILSQTRMEGMEIRGTSWSIGSNEGVCQESEQRQQGFEDERPVQDLSS